MKKSENCGGYFTVEAVLIFTSILIILFGVIYAFMILYQNIVLLDAATSGAQEAAYIVASNQADEVKVDDIVDQKLSKGLFKTSDIKKTVFVDSEGFLSHGTVYVTLEQKIDFPGRNIAELFGGEDVLTLKVSSCAKVTDRPQYMRNINLIREIGQRVLNDINDFTFGIWEKIWTEKSK